MSAKQRYCECGKELKPLYNSTITPKRCQSCENKRKNKALMKQSSLKTGKHTDKTKVKSEKQKAMECADKWFSRYIRFKHSKITDNMAVAMCFTCGKNHNILELDCGHYIGRAHKETRYNENNARPQCTFCNKYRSGEHTKFAWHLAAEITPIKVDELRQLSLFHTDDSIEWYRSKAKEYRLKFNELVKQKGFNPWK